MATLYDEGERSVILMLVGSEMQHIECGGVCCDVAQEGGGGPEEPHLGGGVLGGGELGGCELGVCVFRGEQRAQARSCSSKQKQVYYDTTTLTHCIINIFNNKS